MIICSKIHFNGNSPGSVWYYSSPEGYHFTTYYYHYNHYHYNHCNQEKLIPGKV